MRGSYEVGHVKRWERELKAGLDNDGFRERFGLSVGEAARVARRFAVELPRGDLAGFGLTRGRLSGRRKKRTA